VTGDGVKPVGPKSAFGGCGKAGRIGGREAGPGTVLLGAHHLFPRLLYQLEPGAEKSWMTCIAVPTRQERAGRALRAQPDPEVVHRLRRCEGPCSAFTGAPPGAAIFPGLFISLVSNDPLILAPPPRPATPSCV